MLLRALVIPAPRAPANTNVFVGWIRREFYILSAIIFVIPAPRAPANTNVFVGWIRREFYILSAIIFVIPAQAGIGLGLLLVI